MAVKVSVVVATYNSGDALDAVVESVRGQLPHGEVELVLVDDGSTDGTGERVLELARDADWVVATRIENSGWPSRPRNVGLGLATGEYVLVMDHDDRLFPGALEQMWSAGARSGADMVLGKEVRSAGRTQGLDTFRHNTDDARLVEDDVLLLHTPHRLWRRAFLERAGVRFSETLRRLEDHKILAQSLEHRPRIAVVADHPCYHWITHEGNNSGRLPDPVAYYAALREVLDSVDRWPYAPEVVDHARAMWLRTTVLDRFGAGGALTWSPDYREAMFAQARAVTAERLATRLDPLLPALHRVRAALLRRGELDALLAYVAVDGTVTTTPTLRRHDASGERLDLLVETGLSGREGPVRFRRTGERVHQLPTGPLDGAVAQAVLDVTDDLARARVDVMLTERSTHAEWFLPTEATVELHDEHDGAVLRIRARAPLDPRSALLGHPLGPGTWDVRLRSALLGYDSRTTVRLGEQVPDPWQAGDLRITPYRTRNGRLALTVARTGDGGPATPRTTPRAVPVRIATRRILAGARAARRLRRGGS